MKKVKIILFLSLGCALIGCATNESELILPEVFSDSIRPIESISEDVGTPKSLEETAFMVVSLLQKYDLQQLDEWNKGGEVLFYPYSYVLKGEAQMRSFGSLFSVDQAGEVLTWGISDGEGDPIVMTVSAYFKRFINDVDYLGDRDEMHIGEMKQRGNSLVNVKELFPDAHVVELYRGPRNPNMGEMDWRSLGLVFKEIKEEFILIGLIHNEWTI